jgi:hypothetical protein
VEKKKTKTQPSLYERNRIRYTTKNKNIYTQKSGSYTHTSSHKRRKTDSVFYNIKRR